jgi:alkylhydroperoxidase family enzyme
VGVSDEEIEFIRNMEFDKLDLPEKERKLFVFAIKAQADPHAMGEEDFASLREAGTTDQEIVEILEVTNFGNAINLFCDALGIGADNFLTYAMDEDK